MKHKKQPECKCEIHRKIKPEDGACLCKDVNCDCYKENKKTE